MKPTTADVINTTNQTSTIVSQLCFHSPYIQCQITLVLCRKPYRNHEETTDLSCFLQPLMIESAFMFATISLQHGRNRYYLLQERQTCNTSPYSIIKNIMFLLAVENLRRVASVFAAEPVFPLNSHSARDILSMRPCCCFLPF